MTKQFLDFSERISHIREDETDLSLKTKKASIIGQNSGFQTEDENKLTENEFENIEISCPEFNQNCQGGKLNNSCQEVENFQKEYDEAMTFYDQLIQAVEPIGDFSEVAEEIEKNGKILDEKYDMKNLARMNFCSENCLEMKDYGSNSNRNSEIGTFRLESSGEDPFPLDDLLTTLVGSKNPQKLGFSMEINHKHVEKNRVQILEELEKLHKKLLDENVDLNDDEIWIREEEWGNVLRVENVLESRMILCEMRKYKNYLNLRKKIIFEDKFALENEKINDLQLCDLCFSCENLSSTKD